MAVTAVEIEAAQTNSSDSEVDFSFTPRTLEQRARASSHQRNNPAGTKSTVAFSIFVHTFGIVVFLQVGSYSRA